jgi:hypothetical protein
LGTDTTAEVSFWRQLRAIGLPPGIGTARRRVRALPAQRPALDPAQATVDATATMKRRATIFARTISLALLLALAITSQAEASKRWRYTGHSNIPFEYFQGVTSDPQKRLYFDGTFSGLYRTDSRLHERVRNANVIPPAVTMTEGYNHIGDLSWDAAEGGRLLLPLECFLPIGGNTCKTGSIAVADPRTLQWRYYVKLDPAFIDKAMWAEVSPDGELVWTSSGSGKDLLAYRSADITPANAAPAGPALRPVVRLVGKVPPSGITGATFYRGRLLLAGQATGDFQVWSIDTRTGRRRLEIDRFVVGESEGLDVVRALGGLLHWQVTPLRTSGRFPTFGIGHSALMHFRPHHRRHRRR